MNFDKEELELLNSMESGEWKSVSNLKEEIESHKESARKSLNKDKRVNIRISSFDLNSLKREALQLGLPYQTFISSILHQYITGRLVQK